MKNKPKTEAQARRNMVVYLKNQGNYKIKDFDGMSYNEIRPIFEKEIVKEHADTELEKEEEQADTELEKEGEQTVQVEKEVSMQHTRKRKKTLAKRRTKKQKVYLNDESEELKELLEIVPREDVAIDVESLSTKYPIMDWKTYIVSEKFMYYQVFRGDGSSKNYKILSEMLEDFDRQDVEDLYRLVKERFATSRPEGNSYADREEVSSKSRDAVKDVKSKIRV
ncbi:hypothetical protein Tco_1254330 [Tanacetum coccineum]